MTTPGGNFPAAPPPRAPPFDPGGGKVPFAPVLDIAGALDSPYLESIGMIETVEHPEAPEGLRTLASPFRVNGDRVRSSRAPALGEHNEELLK